MPRQKRLNIAGGIYHVINRGLERRKLFEDKADREEFLRRLAEGLQKTGCQCMAWVLMSNHFHLVIRTGEDALSSLMRSLLTGYAVYFNRRHRRHGYLYQNRYKSILCQEDAYLLELVRYVHLNPIRAGFIKDIKVLEKYPWIGHSAIVGSIAREWQSVDEVLAMFSLRRATAVKKYREFVNGGIKMGRREDLMGGGLMRSAGGWEGIVALKRLKEYWRGDERILGDGEFVGKVLKAAEERLARSEELKRLGWDIERLGEWVCEEFDIGVDDLRAREKITSHFRISSSGCLWPIFPREILRRAVLFLRFRSLRCGQIQPKSERQNC